MHPLTRILAVIFLAMLVQLLTDVVLLMVGAFLALANLFYDRAAAMLRLLRRSRWLVMTLCLVYAFATPGEYVAGWPLDIAPTYEGGYAGLLQAVHLAIMLSGVAILLTTTPRSELVSGIYMLLAPLRWLGCAPERFAIRLWLTFHYFERQPVQRPDQGWSDFFNPLHDAEPDKEMPLLLEIPKLHPMDWSLCVVMFSVLLFWALK